MGRGDENRFQYILNKNGPKTDPRPVFFSFVGGATFFWFCVQLHTRQKNLTKYSPLVRNIYYFVLPQFSASAYSFIYSYEPPYEHTAQAFRILPSRFFDDDIYSYSLRIFCQLIYRDKIEKKTVLFKSSASVSGSDRERLFTAQNHLDIGWLSVVI